MEGVCIAQNFLNRNSGVRAPKASNTSAATSGRGFANRHGLGRPGSGIGRQARAASQTRGRLIELDVTDLPAVRRAPPAEQESQRDRPADLESFTRPDVDVAGLAAGMRRWAV